LGSQIDPQLQPCLLISFNHSDLNHVMGLLDFDVAAAF
jgi:hypothetical protein